MYPPAARLSLKTEAEKTGKDRLLSAIVEIETSYVRSDPKTRNEEQRSPSCLSKLHPSKNDTQSSPRVTHKATSDTKAGLCRNVVSDVFHRTVHSRKRYVRGEASVRIVFVCLEGEGEGSLQSRPVCSSVQEAPSGTKFGRGGS